MSCGLESLLTNVTRWPAETVTLDGDTPAAVIVMVADDGSENDGDPLHDGRSTTNPGSGVLALRAEAFGPRGVRQVVELTVARPEAPEGGPAGLRVLSWRLRR